MTKFYENWKKLHISNILGFFTHYSRIFFPGKSNSAFFFHYFLISTVAISEKLMNKFREKLFTEVQTLIDH